MQDSRGQIVATVFEQKGSHVIVEVEAAAACARCAEGKGCGAGLFGSAPGQRRVEAAIAPGLILREGDQVNISIAPADLLGAAVVVYGYPLLGAILAVSIAYVSGAGDVAAALAAVGGLATGTILARYRLKNSGCQRKATPIVVASLHTANG